MWVSQFDDMRRKQVAMGLARDYDSIEVLRDRILEDDTDEYIKGAYYCRMLELQETMTPVGKMVVDRYIEEGKKCLQV